MSKQEKNGRVQSFSKNSHDADRKLKPGKFRRAEQPPLARRRPADRTCNRNKETICFKKKEPQDQDFQNHYKSEPNMGFILQSIPRMGMGKAYSYEFKFQCVQWAMQYGIKPTALRTKVSRNTIRNWFRNYLSRGKSALKDQRQGPISKPLKTPKKIEDLVIKARKKATAFGPKRLKYFFDLPCSLSAIARILKQNGLTRMRRLKAQKRHDLRMLKAQKYKGMQHLQMDLKHLTDIPFYVAQMKRLNLPKFQYTVRDTKTGMLFLGYSNELSELNARVMVDYVLWECRKAKEMDIPNQVVQTDNGSEFSGNARWFSTSPFSQAVAAHAAQHVYIRPGHKNAQADVESSHRLIEEEFYDVTAFSSREDFIEKAEAYRLFFNLTRPNYSKHFRVPWQIMQNDWPDSDFASHMALLAVIDLDKIALETSKQSKGQSIPNLTGIVWFLLF